MNYKTFHGYKIYENGDVYNKKGRKLTQHKRKRKGDGFDYRVTLYFNKKRRHFTVQRLVAACFLGPIVGYEINHKDRNTENNHISNLERVTASENQKHWRSCDLSI